MVVLLLGKKNNYLPLLRHDNKKQPTTLQAVFYFSIQKACLKLYHRQNIFVVYENIWLTSYFDFFT